MKTIAITFLLALSTLGLAQEMPTSDMPAFGSSCAGIERLSEKDSSFIPRHSLVGPGELDGRWLSSTTSDTLRVRPLCIGKKNGESSTPEDEFTMTLRSGSETLVWNFTASYGEFRIYGVDVDADGQEEIVLEYGEGLGTFVYVHKLTVLAPAKDDFCLLFKIDLNGYLVDPDLREVVSWERTYSWRDVDGDSRLELLIRLAPPPVIPRNVRDADLLLVLQHPDLIFKFNPGKERFEIIESRLSPFH